ncbi:MAG: hypothetical protein AUG00_09045 [Candidatus Rokubacteria bacterium 13_1_20CM_2_70_7]|nr:MAG: hypothetical protein AUG00_09045 [Candidatus Rokubacteria bacterium 13_1_20CM_2_70_7]
MARAATKKWPTLKGRASRARLSVVMIAATALRNTPSPATRWDDGFSKPENRSRPLAEPTTQARAAGSTS